MLFFAVQIKANLAANLHYHQLRIKIVLWLMVMKTGTELIHAIDISIISFKIVSHALLKSHDNLTTSEAILTDMGYQ